MNLVGNWEMDLLRQFFGILDLNPFVTNFVTTTLLELEGEGYLNLDDYHDELLSALKAILEFRDKNQEQNVPIYSFWPQKKMGDIWSAYPTNLMKPVSYFNTTEKWLEWTLKELHLDHLKDEVHQAFKEFANLIQSFKIPADTDDSAVNLALGGVLKRFKPEWFDGVWKDANAQYQVLYDELVSKAYSAHSEGIDPRTYYFLHDFMAKYPNATLPTTWIMSNQKEHFPRVAMPFNVNNIDVSVISNFLYGMTYHILFVNPEALNQPGMKNLYKSSVDYIEWVILTKAAVTRPDLGLTYYPSIYDFYWLVSRVAKLLDKVPSSNPSLIDCKERLANALKKEGVSQIMSLSMTVDGATVWDDFLGDADPKHLQGEDRLFSTALCINALLDIFHNDPPSMLKDAIRSSVGYLRDHIFDASSAKLSNAFFSGSVKGFKSLPFFYPANDYHYLNGTKIAAYPPPQDMSLITPELVLSIKGLVDRDQYANFLTKRWFGLETPQTFQSFNSDTFPYW
eukprot:CAMPEP_0117431130 /NCGR_PEP_ID=MMETSP0758-20121206/10675_1 /TAXON_ID=63605 /ORGANISM="Percolomonas cosmopolitus, Strain AE-1 (ATCC 50343)" /LENGTH=509 /DNA_ID=CAMNT_0005219853 /DNA_START=219 /DNA_END=1745 /DNA_ORIENTATION=-